MTTVAAVAKTKPKAETDNSAAVRVIHLHVRVSVEYKEWIARFAEHERSDLSDLIDAAIARHAKARKFDPPPKR